MWGGADVIWPRFFPPNLRKSVRSLARFFWIQHLAHPMLDKGCRWYSDDDVIDRNRTGFRGSLPDNASLQANGGMGSRGQFRPAHCGIRIEEIQFPTGEQGRRVNGRAETPTAPDAVHFRHHHRW